MAWNPEGWQPDGWQPDGYEPDGSSAESHATDVVPVGRIVALPVRRWIVPLEVDRGL
jgi:hypothetical protein